MRRDPVARPGELRAAWSTARKHGGTRDGMRGDLVYAFGKGCERSDCRVLDYHFARENPKWGSDTEVVSSLLAELHARGYDLTTLRFSIQKRTQPTPSGRAAPEAR